MKNTYRIIQRIDTWATVEVEAENAQRALDIANANPDLEWAYDTDYDSAVTVTWDLICEGHPEVEDLSGETFHDPYLGVDDIVWQVTGNHIDDEWEAEVVEAPVDDIIGQTDIYEGEHIRMFRGER
jgi:hypothetical protein